MQKIGFGILLLVLAGCSTSAKVARMDQKRVLASESMPSECLATLLQGQQPDESTFKQCQLKCESLRSQATSREFSISEKQEFKSCMSLDRLSEAVKSGDFSKPCKWLKAQAYYVEFSAQEKRAFQDCLLRGE